MRAKQNLAGSRLAPAALIPVFSHRFGSWHVSLTREPFRPKELETHYDRAAKGWQSTVNKLGFTSAYAGLIEDALGPAWPGAARGPVKVLDAGIGTGAMSRAFLDVAAQPVALTGVDLSADMLRCAAVQLQDISTTLELVQSDLAALPFADNSFDVVLGAHVLEHLPAPHVAMAELARVLKPGGRVILCMTRRSAFGAYIHMKWRTHQVAVPTAFGWLRQSGFENVRAIRLRKVGFARHFSIGYVADLAKL